MRIRLRERYTPEQLAAVYPAPRRYDRESGGAAMNDCQADHFLRVQATIALAAWMHDGGPVADLSCGDGQIARALTATPILGDLAAGYAIQGSIEETIHQLGPVELFICSETLEHLDNPDAVLVEIRKRARKLIVSTPYGEDTPVNPEHYWGWDKDGVGEMLAAAGFTPTAYMSLAVLRYPVFYQLWGLT